MIVRFSREQRGYFGARFLRRSTCLEKAPTAVRAHLERIPESLVEVLSLDSAAEALAAEYIHDGAVGKNERADALHIALARRPGSMSS